MITVKSVHFRKITRPLKITFATSLGEKNCINSIIVTVHLSNGLSGSGECPTSFTMKQETIENICRIVSHSSALLKDTEIASYEAPLKRIRMLYPSNPMTAAGIESALFRAYLETTGMDEHTYFEGKAGAIKTDLTIPFTTDFEKLEVWLRYARLHNFDTYKVKVSGNYSDDKTLITRLCDHLTAAGDDFRIRLDGNQGYSVATALSLVDFVRKKKYPVEVFEQPIRKTDYKGLREITRKSSLPIILDETVNNTNDLARVIGENAGHGVNIKIAKSGIAESLKLYNMSKENGLRLMIGCMTETMIGLSTGIYFAAGKGDFDYVDLDSIHFLRHRQAYGNIHLANDTYLISGRQNIST